jgi:hypothetical protein
MNDCDLPKSHLLINYLGMGVPGLSFVLPSVELNSEPHACSAGTLPALFFAFVIVDIGFLFMLRLYWTVTLLSVLPCRGWDDRHMAQHPVID